MQGLRRGPEVLECCEAHVGGLFYPSIEKESLPIGLRGSTFGACFCHSIVKVSLPGGLQCLTVEYLSYLGVEQMSLPYGLLSLTVGSCYRLSLEKVGRDSVPVLAAFGMTRLCLSLIQHNVFHVFH